MKSEGQVIKMSLRALECSWAKLEAFLNCVHLHGFCLKAPSAVSITREKCLSSASATVTVRQLA